MRPIVCLTHCLIWIALGTLAAADDKAERAIDDVRLAPHWIHSDIDQAIRLARTNDKPVLVLFRCVPCQCAESLDAEITDPDSSLNEVLSKYICVRVIHMAGIDLTRFQFDYDVSLVAILMNADGTIYGRYGTRLYRPRADNTHVSAASFRKALERGLAIHQEYPLNRDQLAGKQPRPVPLKTPEEAPELAAVAKAGLSEKNCIHCHMAGEALLRHAAERGKLTKNDVWRFPLLEGIGLKIDKDDGLLVKWVNEESAAERADIRPGDVLQSLNGQVLISQADVQWALHHVPEETDLKLTLLRQGKLLSKSISVSGRWKWTDISWRPSLGPIRSGLHVAPLSAGERREAGLDAATPALMIRYAFRTAGQAGLRSGDIIVELDGRPAPSSEADFLTEVRLRNPSRKSIVLTVISKRNPERRQVALPLTIELIPE